MGTLLSYLDKVLSTLPEREERPFLRYAIKRVDEENLSVIEAPTGYGKTVISQTVALSSLYDGFKCLVAYPLRTLLEDQISKFRTTLGGLGFDESYVGVRYMQHPESRYLIKPVTLTTIDTLSLTLFGISPEDIEKVMRYYDGTSMGSLGHYLFSRSMVLLSDLVLDEVHLLFDSTKSLNFLIALIKLAIAHGGRLVMMSATIPSALKDLLRKEIPELTIIEFKDEPDEKFLEERKRKSYSISIEKLSSRDKFERILNFLKEGFVEGFKRSLVVFNTVSEALKFYELVRKELNWRKDRVVLLHSRFTSEDRERLAKRVKELRGQDEYMIISTQVIEAGVDVSSNIFVTDVAPASTLIQRIGRFLRYGGEREGHLMIWYEDFDGANRKYKGIYDLELVKRTLEFLDNKCSINFHLPEDYNKLLDYVYDISMFRVSRQDVRELISINNVLESPKFAIDTFMRLEGSFVRESAVAPVIPRTLLREDINAILDLNQKIIPIDLSIISRIKPEEELVYKDGRYEIMSVSDSIWFKKEKILKHTLSSSFVAFIIDSFYDNELGLRVSEDE